MRRFPTPGRSRTVVTALILAAALPPAASALTFLDLATGDDAAPSDARSIALGRTRTGDTTGAFTGSTNPALLSRVDGGSLSFGGGVLKAKETRSIPAYDSFDAFLVESIYVLNDDYQWTGGFGAAYGLADERLPFPVGVALSYTPVRDFQYDYSEEVRSNDAFTQPRDARLAINEIQGDGVLGAWTIAAGAQPVDRLAIGAGVEILRGDQDLVRRIRWIEAGGVDETRLAIDGLAGTRGTVGLTFSPEPRFDVSATWRSACTVDGDLTITGDREALGWIGTPVEAPDSIDVRGSSVGIRIPEEWSLGFAYRPRAKVRTTVRLDATLTEWADWSHGFWTGRTLDDVWDFRLGVEHVFYNGFPARFGFRYAPSPQDDEIATTAFTFGAGLDVGPFRTDLAFEIANRSYRTNDVFDDALFGGESRVTTDLVEENTSSAYATVTWAID